MSTYSDEFKEQMVSKLLQPGGVSVLELSKETGISTSALYQWVRIYRNNNQCDGSMENKKNIKSSVWPAEAKLEAIIKTQDMTDEELGEFCRGNRLYAHLLKQWRQEIIETLQPASKKEKNPDLQKLKVENKLLRNELRKKESALAETAALLVLKKKASLLWGEPEES